MNYIGLTQKFNLLYDKLYDNKKNLYLQLQILKEYGMQQLEFSKKISSNKSLYKESQHQNNEESMIKQLQAYFRNQSHELELFSKAASKIEQEAEAERRKLSDIIRDRRKEFDAKFKPIAVLRQHLSELEGKVRECYKQLEFETDRGKILDAQKGVQDYEKQQRNLVDRIRAQEQAMDQLIHSQASVLQQLDRQFSDLVEHTNTKIANLFIQTHISQQQFIQQNFLYKSAQDNLQIFFDANCNNFSTSFLQTQFNDQRYDSRCKAGAEVARAVQSRSPQKVKQNQPITPQNHGVTAKMIPQATSAKRIPQQQPNQKQAQHTTDQSALDDMFGSLQQQPQANVYSYAYQQSSQRDNWAGDGQLGQQGWNDNWNADSGAISQNQTGADYSNAAEKWVDSAHVQIFQSEAEKQAAHDKAVAEANIKLQEELMNKRAQYDAIWTRPEDQQKGDTCNNDWGNSKDAW